MTGMVVVCDLNVWYDHDRSQRGAGVTQVGTWMNVFELAQTPNWFKKLEFTRAAAISLINESGELRMDNPWARVAALSKMSFVGANDYSAEDRLEFLSLMANGSSLTEDGLVKLRARIDDRKQSLVGLAEGLGKATRAIREVGGVLNVNSTRIQTDVLRSLLSIELNKWAGELVDPDDVNWADIELFMNALHEFVFGVDSIKSSPAGNDFGDLFNLLYVNPGERYWTNEKYWNRVIKRAGMGHYLFSANEVSTNN